MKPEKAKWIWLNSETKKDEYAVFLQDFEVREQKTVLKISADSNYTVWVNGKMAGFGQYPDYPHYKIYDEIDITEYCIGGYHIIEEDGMFTVGEHDYSNIVIVEPTCTTQGYTAYVCVCGQSYTESVVDCNGHVHGEAVEENRIPPALLDDGQYDSVTYCTVCGDELARETIIIEGAPINWETVLIWIVIFLLAFAILI